MTAAPWTASAAGAHPRDHTEGSADAAGHRRDELSPVRPGRAADPLRAAAVAIDGGPGAEPPGAVDAWLVTDEHAELRAALRRLARARDMPAPAVAEHVTGTLAVRPFPVEHTSHPAYGYRISAGGQIAVWAPEFWRFPCWADRADLLFAEAAGWDRPIRFRGGVGGHASVAQVAAEAARRGVRRLVYAHIGRPSLRAMDAGLQPPFGEWGAEGRTYTVAG